MGNSCGCQSKNLPSFVTSDALSPELAQDLLKYAEACYVAYFQNSPELDEHIQKWKYTSGFDRIHSDANLRFLVLNNRASTKIVFRGTDNFQNVISDLDAIETITDESLGGARFHKGFYQCAEKMYKDVLKFVGKFSRIYVLGHSLGGAIAVIISLWLIRDGYNVLQTVTLGQPRVTLINDIPKLENKIQLTRLVNEDDPVCVVPMRPFKHFGSKVFLGPKGFSTASDLEAGDLHEFFTSNPKEHSCLTYIARCEIIIGQLKKSGKLENKNEEQEGKSPQAWQEGSPVAGPIELTK